MRVLFVCKAKSSLSGFTSGLYNSARFVSDFLDSQKLTESSVVLVDNENQIDHHIVKFNADIVIIEAIWVTPKKLNELAELNRHKNRKFIVRIHSKIPFLSNEGQAFKFIAQYFKIKNVQVSPNTAELFDSLKTSFYLKRNRLVYLPNIYPLEFNYKKSFGYKDEINICCFGAIRPMKNTLQQVIAAIKFADSFKLKLNFHINSTRIEQDPHNSVLKNIIALFETNKRHKLVLHGWYSHAEFIEVCKQMDLALQVSYSETFNIVTADLISCGVPVIGSEEIDYLPFFTQANPNELSSIYNCMSVAYIFPSFTSGLQRKRLAKYVNRNKGSWLNLISI